MNGVWLTGRTCAFISADLEHHVGKPHCCFTGWEAHTRQVFTAGGDREQLRGQIAARVQKAFMSATMVETSPPPKKIIKMNKCN